MSLWIYPGSFDPITVGHIDVIKRASRLCSELVVGVLNNTVKNSVFSIDERIGMINLSLQGIGNIKVEGFEGLLVDYAGKKNADAIVRGLRAVSDFEYEFQMAALNRGLKPDIETVFIMSAPQYFYVSSTMVKEIAGFGGDIKGFVPDKIINVVKNRLYKGDIP